MYFHSAKGYRGINVYLPPELKRKRTGRRLLEVDIQMPKHFIRPDINF